MIALFFLWLSAQASVEELPTLGLGGLVYYSPVIFSATPLPGATETWQFSTGNYTVRKYLVQEIIRQDSLALPDTILVEVGNYCLEKTGFKEYLFYGFYSKPLYTDTTPVFSPFLSGIRPFIDQRYFIPFQHEAPGCYYFHEKTGETAQDWISQTYKTMERFDSILALRRIQPLAAQNQAIFNWITQHEHCWSRESSGNPESNFSDCDLGQYNTVVFEWINGNGIWQDAWKSMMRSETLNGWGQIVVSRPQDSPNAFSNKKARLFLLKRIRTGDHAPIAIQLLAANFWDDYDYETKLGFPLTEQKEIIEVVLQQLYLEETKYAALYLLRTAFLFPQMKEQDELKASIFAALHKAMDSSSDAYFKQTVEQLIKDFESKK